MADASLEWGFKESFRGYIEGIAAGGWELADIEYAYPAFVWSGGAGSIDVEAGTGLVSYSGSVRFTGHDGALDTTLANARIELAGDTGYVVFDVTGETQGGEAVGAPGVRFVSFDVPAGSLAGEALVLEGAATTLTPEGAAAFGTYAEGEEFDALSATIPLPGDCAPAAAPAAAAPIDDENEAVASAPQVTTTMAAAEAPVWPWIAGGAVALLIAAGVLVVIRRRNATALTEPGRGAPIE